MAVRFIIGKPGGGKSLCAVRLMLKELENPKGRRVLTNLPIRLGFVAAEMVRRGQEPGPALERIRLIDDEQVREFYCLAEGRKTHKDRTENLIVEDRGEGTVNLIDEAHLFWPSRDFRQTGATLLSYLSQHRKLGDDVYLITQHSDQTDKALRRLTEEYLVCTNLEKRRMWGFRGPANQFMVRTYFEQPNSLSKAAETITYTRRQEESDCYDTSVGVGVTAGISDAGKVSKGLGPKWAMACLLAVACVIGVSLYFGPRFVSGGLLWLGGAGAKKGAKMANRPSTNQIQSAVSIQRASTNGPATEGLAALVESELEKRSQTVASPINAWPAVPSQVHSNGPATVGNYGGAVANPDASAGSGRVVVVYGFDGRPWAVRRQGSDDPIRRADALRILQEIRDAALEFENGPRGAAPYGGAAD